MSNEKAVVIKMGFREFVSRNRKSGGYLLKKSSKRIFMSICRAFLLFGLCFLILQPILNKISISFMAEKDLYDATVISLPRNFTLENYKIASYLLNYRSALLTSFIVAMTIGLVQIASCTLVGYGFARFKFPFKRFWFMCVILLIVIPPQTIMSSLYLHFRFFDVFGIIKLLTGQPMNMLNTSAPYYIMVGTCMGLKSGLYIFMIRQYFRGVPKELEEAAYVDGCGKLKTFIRIMLPDAKPILTSCFLFSFVWQWTDSFYSSLFLNNLKLLPNGLRAIPEALNDYLVSMVGTGTNATIGYQQAISATGMLMVIAPLLILYIIAQKGFVESLSQTGIKM